MINKRRRERLEYERQEKLRKDRERVERLKKARDKRRGIKTPVAETAEPVPGQITFTISVFHAKILAVGLVGLIALAAFAYSQDAFNKTNEGEIAEIAEANTERISRLLNCYFIYSEAHNFTGPKNEAELKEYLLFDEGIQTRLKRMGITADEVEKMFTSERDNKKFNVRWAHEGIEDAAIIFEADGVDGRRLVAFKEPREVSSAEYDALLSGQIKSGKSRKDEMTTSGRPLTESDSSNE
jgi:hypothetical protein